MKSISRKDEKDKKIPGKKSADKIKAKKKTDKLPEKESTEPRLPVPDSNSGYIPFGG